MPDHFDQTVVLNQLRYSGMLETVKIRRTGFPIRRSFQDFCFRLVPTVERQTTKPEPSSDPQQHWILTTTFSHLVSRYKVLMRGVLMPDDPRGSCVQLLHLYDSSSVEWQLGKTKVRDGPRSH